MQSGSRATWIAVPMLALSLHGCRLLVEAVIDEQPAEQLDGGVDGSTASIDADLTDANTDCMSWPETTSLIDPCDIPLPDDDLTIGPGEWSYDSNSGALTDPLANASFPTSELRTIDGVELRIISVNRIDLKSGSVLRLEGQRPVVLVSWSDAVIDGEIDASSRPGRPGAGANAMSCTTAGTGAEDANGAGGGAGGGLGSKGGDGADGQNGMAAGGLAADPTPPTSLQGGCPGAAGGNALAGAGGDGGGGVALIAREQIVVSGVVSAGGSGGGGASGGRSGGGGAGSGGVILIDAPTIELSASAIVAANGGGGGGGADNGVAGPGGDGQASATPATAGLDQGKGGLGGVGSDSAGGPGDPGGSDDRGGGGGGGGAGAIFLRSANLMPDSGSTISPSS